MISHSVYRSVITLANGARVTLPYDVAKVLEAGEVLIVMLQVPPDTSFNENVFAIDRDGKILWQVPQRRYVYDSSPYTDMGLEKEGVLLSSWDGRDVLVDLTTGRILESRESR